MRCTAPEGALGTIVKWVRSHSPCSPGASYPPCPLHGQHCSLFFCFRMLWDHFKFCYRVALLSEMERMDGEPFQARFRHFLLKNSGIHTNITSVLRTHLLSKAVLGIRSLFTLECTYPIATSIFFFSALWFILPETKAFSQRRYPI